MASSSSRGGPDAHELEPGPHAPWVGAAFEALRAWSRHPGAAFGADLCADLGFLPSLGIVCWIPVARWGWAWFGRRSFREIDASGLLLRLAGACADSGEKVVGSRDGFAQGKGSARFLAPGQPSPLLQSGRGVDPTGPRVDLASLWAAVIGRGLGVEKAVGERGRH